MELLHLEYSVHQLVFEARARVPVVAIADGIVMGAGAGLFMAASTRVASENTLFAMPEVSIGLCPDAGTYQPLPSLLKGTSTPLVARCQCPR